MEHRIERTRYDVVMISTNQNQIAAKTRPKAGVRRFDFDEAVSGLVLCGDLISMRQLAA